MSTLSTSVSPISASSVRAKSASYSSVGFFASMFISTVKECVFRVRPGGKIFQIDSERTTSENEKHDRVDLIQPTKERDSRKKTNDDNNNLTCSAELVGQN